MQTSKRLLVLSLMLLCSPSLYAQCTSEPDCCDNMGGISYCDSSGGRYVCNNGYYSDCYCTRHAVMDLQQVQGCCLWQGGVHSNYNSYGMVICKDGTISEVCSIQTQNQSTISDMRR